MPDAAQTEWIRRVLAIEIATAPPDAVVVPGDVAAAPGYDDAETAEGLQDRLKSVAGDIRFHGAMEALAVPVRSAAEAVKAHAADAADWVGRLEDALAAFVRAKRQAAVADTVRSVAASAEVGVVAFAKLRLALASARTGYAMAVSNLEAAGEALLESPDFVDDPRSTSAEALAAVADIGNRVPDIADFTDEVEDALDAMAGTADPALRAAAVQDALDAIAEYRAELDAEPLLAFMEDSPAGTFAIRGALTGALDQLADALAG